MKAQAQAYAPNQDWTSRGFILENVAKGVLQAIASLSVYALAIWLAIKYSSKFILLGDAVDVKAEGYAVDKDYSDVIYVPENAAFSIPKQSITWDKEGKKQSLGLKPGTTYILPNGYKIEMVKKGSNSAVKEKAGASGGDSRLTTWRLKGTLAEGVHCHKPATVSGGGKSEISKRVCEQLDYFF